ncbi:MAG: Fic family protein, partial [Comamonadaceae bacterium]
ALTEAVQTIVRGKLVPTEKAIKRLASESVSEKDVDPFSRLLAQAIEQLHEGSVARYRLKRSEFLVWKSIMSNGK